MRRCLSRVHVPSSTFRACFLCQHISAREPSSEPARPNTSVDALNTAIILCLVGRVGGWRGRNGRRPTICGKSAATKKPRRDSLAADLRRRDAFACQRIPIVHHGNGSYYLISILCSRKNVAKKFSTFVSGTQAIATIIWHLVFFYWKTEIAKFFQYSVHFLLNLRQQGNHIINKNSTHV